MKNLYNSMKAIIGFLFITVLVSSFFGEKAAQNSVLFILLGMLILNADSFIKVLENGFTDPTTSSNSNTGSTTHVSSSGTVHGGSSGGF